MRVCRKNGWADLADSWERYLEGSPGEEAVDTARAPMVDDVIKRSIKRLVASTFTKDRDYAQTIENIQSQYVQEM